MSHGHVAELPAPPARIRFSMISRVVAVLAVLVGAGAFGWALQGEHPELAWSAYLIGVFYALSLGVFGAAWISILYLSKGFWSVTTRRIPEAMTAWLLPGGALALGVGLGAHSLYHWTHADAVATDALLQHKEPFLNLTAFTAITGVCFAVWVVLGTLLVRNSRRQDETGEGRLSRTNTTLSAIFIVLFALTFSAVSYYLLMSLEPHWFSTMFAVLTFTDMMQSGLAVVVLVGSVFVLQGRLKGFVNQNHLHGAGKMLFAATGFWAYIFFCQFLLIWYSNIPEETIYFVKRWDNGWLPYLLVLPVVKFAVPFLYMLPRTHKRCPKALLFPAILILLAQFWELYLMVGPGIGHGEHAAHAHPPLVELAVTAGFGGLFFLVFSWSFGRHNPVPLKDPNLRASLHTES